MLKWLSLLISILFTLTLLFLSLASLREVVGDIPTINDKVAHAIAHLIFVILWFVTFKFSFKFNKALVIVVVLSIVSGIAIELLQGWVTVSRESDYKDVLANLLGTVFAAIFLLVLKKGLLKKKNSLLFL